MQIKEILARDITKTIDPVIYFHQKSPEILEREVSEYVITTKKDAEETGIHEQYVNLLTSISKSLDSGESLPASWISGFFGSGKSSFAKLLGLSFGDVKLPSGKLLSQALVERDDNPNAKEFQEIWKEAKSKFGDTIAVVFDISSVAKPSELPSATIYRQIQIELGYSNKEAVARYELSLQKEGKYEDFLKLYREKYHCEWNEDKDKIKAPDHFSNIYHILHPKEFPNPTDWYKSHYTSKALKEDEAIRNAVSEIKQMMELKHPNKRLLIVIDEMSQFIGKNTDRMLNLQTFVSEIGALPNHPVWLFVTGQEKLEDNIPGIEISKMQDRFPSKFRVHLHKTNVNEIVRRRILKKSDKMIPKLRELFSQEVISKIKNNGFESEKVTQDELIDYYPLLPAYVPLILDLSQAIKAYSTKAQADSASVRSVLQTIFDLFNHNRTNFKDRAVGDYITMKDVYDIIGSALGSEVVGTIDSISNKLKEEVPLAVDIAKIIAIMELNSELKPVKTELIQKLLFANLSSLHLKDDVTKAIERLERENFIYLEDKRGYRIKDFVAQEWGKDKARLPVSEEETSQLIIEFSKDIFESVPRPKIFDVPIELEFSHRGRVDKTKQLPKVRIDLNFREDGLFTATRDYFISESSKEFPTNYSKEKVIFFVPGETDRVDTLARQIIQTEKMLRMNSGTLPSSKDKVRGDEKRKLDNDKDRLKQEIIQSWATGRIFFYGREYQIQNANSTDQYLQKLKQQLEDFLPEIFFRFRDAQVNITTKEIEKLFDPEIISPSPTLLDSSDGLAILTRKSGQYEPVTDQGIPQRILDFIKDKSSVKGVFLLGYFGSQPFGYPQNVIQAVVAGLLRAEQLKIKQPDNREATSYRDEGIKASILNTSSFKQLDIQPQHTIEISPRDKKQCVDFFESDLEIKGVNIDSNSIFDAIFKHFPSFSENVLEIQEKITKLGLSPIDEFSRLHKAFDQCRKDKSVAGSVRTLKNHLPELKEGMQLFKEAKSYFTPDGEDRLRKLIDLNQHEIRQLKELGEELGVDEDIKRIENKLGSDRPWKELADLNSSSERIRNAYKEIRSSIILKNRDEIEASYYQIKSRKGYDQLTEEERDQIKTVLESSLQQQDIDSLYPSLLQVKSFGNQIAVDKSKANDLFDELLFKKEKPIEIRKVKHHLDNRDIFSEADLDEVLSELRENCLAEIRKGYSIRLI
ncbi:BREX system P-loop protein BrxC [Leptospira bandrabouensis]|uniref:BREX system P-loop protein BrxC n=1 Tax=Leptospira bandrabouensis TaxID=2484903 RepID=UPI001EE8278A|nr:BREX system P-loop protein BrxC [Leptospira bandrabouensis]MCG6146506.1 BREX system P-loop protein BrxC [Leptospira bandrabouensis]MCG6161878.1 BREX system P-loop protein BrxC [Leptospira bandrabouensis]MCG6166071.1 BREX system P-loop protein BrxC [Leptospira bandrabouensis]